SAAGGAEDSPAQIQPTTISCGRNCSHASAVSLGRQRISAEWQTVPAARYSGTLHGDGAWTGDLCPDRTGAHRTNSQQQAYGSAGHSGRGGGNHQVQDQEAAGGSAAGGCQAEPCAGERYFRRSDAADEFFEAAGG